MISDKVEKNEEYLNNSSNGNGEFGGRINPDANLGEKLYYKPNYLIPSLFGIILLSITLFFLMIFITLPSNSITIFSTSNITYEIHIMDFIIFTLPRYILPFICAIAVWKDAVLIKAGSRYRKQRFFSLKTWKPIWWGISVFLFGPISIPLYLSSRKEFFLLNNSKRIKERNQPETTQI